MKLLDLFCGVGGAAAGYHAGGFAEIVGVDIEPQPLYPFAFALGDALSFLAEHGRDFDAVHASPPCQSYSGMSNRHGSAAPRLIAPLRDLLLELGVPYVIENVTGARHHLVDPVRVCGRSLGIAVHRHRLFESSAALMAPACSGGRDPFGLYGKRLDGRLLWTRRDGSELRACRTIADARAAVGMPWSDWNGIRECVPPAYTELLAPQLLASIDGRPS